MLMHGRRRVVEEYVVVGSSLLGPPFGFLGRTGYMCVIGRTCFRFTGRLPDSNRMVGAWFPGRPWVLYMKTLFHL
jgi:hypothetical protein